MVVFLFLPSNENCKSARNFYLFLRMVGIFQNIIATLLEKAFVNSLLLTEFCWKKSAVVVKEEITKIKKIWKLEPLASIGKRENTAWIQPLQDLVEKYTLQEPPQQQESVCGCLCIYSLDYPSYLGNGKHQLPTAVKKPICVHLISDLLCLGHIAELRKRGTYLYWFLID